MVNGLPGLVRSYLDDDEVALIPQDPRGEWWANTWSYSSVGPVDVPAVVTALGDVVQELRSRLAALDPHPGVVPWEDLHDVSDPEPDDVEPLAPFPVWAVQVC